MALASVIVLIHTFLDSINLTEKHHRITTRTC